MSSNDCCDDALEEDPRYALAEEIVRNKIASDSTGDFQVLQNLSRDEIIVVSGSADFIQNVFNKIHLPHTLIAPEKIDTFKLEPTHTVYMNCHPTGYTASAKKKIKQFVADGGLLITTDYVLNMLLTDIFPQFVGWAGNQTGDKSVPIESIDDEYDEVLKAFKGETSWKLAGGSHPITVKDKQNVTVLISSAALEKEYPGQGAVLIKFQYMQGTVYHMISHFHLQHGSTTADTEGARASDYARQKGATQETIDKMERLEISNAKVNFTDIQNASVTTEMAYRAAMGQKKKSMNRSAPTPATSTTNSNSNVDQPEAKSAPNLNQNTNQGKAKSKRGFWGKK